MKKKNKLCVCVCVCVCVYLCTVMDTNKQIWLYIFTLSCISWSVAIAYQINTVEPPKKV